MLRRIRCVVLGATLVGVGAGGACGSDEDVAMRPYELFDEAEAARVTGDHTRARAAYRELVEWAASDPLGDGWGGSALAPYAFWRWTQYVREAGSPDLRVVDTMLAVEQTLRHARFFTGIFSSPTHLEALPQFREESWLTLALLADQVGRTDAARYLFLDYLPLARDPVPAGDAAALQDRMVADGWARVEALDLMRANRLRELQDNVEAVHLLDGLRNATTGSVRQRARLSLAQVRWATGDDGVAYRVRRRQVLELLDAVVDEARDPDVLQEAYYLRGRVRQSFGTKRWNAGFIEDMETLASEFATGRRAADALLRLADHYEDEYARTEGNELFESALTYYERLRQLPTPHNREDSMYFRHAMALYTRSLVSDATRARDLDGALDLLQRLNDAKPQGELWLHSLFWRARIKDLRENPDRAAELYRQVAAEDPFGYYGIRALMHLHDPDGAVNRLLPPDPVRDRLTEAMRFTVHDGGASVSGTTPYHDRIRQLLGESDRYREALGRFRAFRESAAGPLHGASLAELDESGVLGEIALLLAVRQDAFAAVARDPRAANAVAIAANVGRELGDWPVALTLLTAEARDRDTLVAVRQHPLYVPTAYPDIERSRFQDVAARVDIEAEMLYSLARRESRFSTHAVSGVGAVGLFQFTPPTFERLSRRWELLKQPDLRSDRELMFAYLGDPDRSTRLVGCWLRKEFLDRYTASDAGRLHTIMGHNVGDPAVRGWRTRWRELQQGTDIEYMVETAGNAQTRNLARGVLMDMAVVDAAGLFDQTGAGAPTAECGHEWITGGKQP